MKALTLHQPYASAIALGLKTIETRGYRTHHRGPIAIHAASYMRPEYMSVIRDMPEADAAAFVAAGYEVGGKPSLIKLPQACIVAIAAVVEVRPVESLLVHGDADDQEQYWGNYAPGRWGWILSDIRRLATPIPTRGFQGLWNWEPPADLQFVSDSVPSVSELRVASVTQSDSAASAPKRAGLLTACRLPRHINRPPFATSN